MKITVNQRYFSTEKTAIKLNALFQNKTAGTGNTGRITLEDAYLWLLKNKGAGTEEA